MAEKPITIGLNQDSDPNEFEPSQENVDRLSQLSVDEPIGDLREQATRIAVSAGIEKNPDNHAKVANLAVETGLPEDTVERQQTAIESRQKALRMLAPDFGQRAPTIRNKFRDPSFVGLSHDDVENLVQTEELMRAKNLGYFEKIGANFRKNQAVVAASDIGVARWQAQLGIGDEVSEREILRLENLQKDMGFKSDEGFFAGIPIESVGMLPMIFDVVSEGGVAAAGGAAVGGLVGAAVTRTPAGAVAGAKIGGGIGFKIGVFHSVFNIESGLAYNDFIADEGVDRDLAAKAAIAVGIINGSLEFVSLKLIGRTATPAVRSLIRRRVRQAMATETGRKIIQRIAGRYLSAVAGEGLTEGAQEVTTMFGDVFTSQFKDGKEVNEETLDQAFGEAFGKLPEIIKSDQVKEAAVVGVQAAAGLSTPGTVASAVVDARRTQTKTQVEQSRIDKIVELSGSSKVRGRSGRVYRQTIEEVAAEIEEATGEVNEIYWTAKEALAWLEAENIDITEPPPNAAVASVIEQLNDALASDGDIVLSIADFATDIAPSDSFQETVRAHVKLSEDTFTQDEAGNVDETIEKRIKRLVADAQVTLEQQQQTEVIAEQVVTQLVDTNKLTTDEAKISSSLITEYVLTKAARTGLSVEEVFKVMGLTIVGPEVQLEGQTLDQVIESGVFQGKQLEKLRGEREALTTEDEGISTERGQILEFFANLISPVKKKGDIEELPAIALTDDAAVEQRLQDLLFRGSFQDGVSLRSEPGQQTVLQRSDKKATAASLFEDVQGLKARDDELSARQKEISTANKDIDARVDTAFSGRQVLEQGPADKDQLKIEDLRQVLELLSKRDPNIARASLDALEGQSLRDVDKNLVDNLRGTEILTDAQVKVLMDTPIGGILEQRKDGEVRGEILLDDDAQGAIIRLGEAADLSTFLHESGHLFLEMEKRFFNDPNISEEAKADSQAILDWLGVESFEDIEAEHHEKWARGFEAYLYEGKAPSAELRAPFRRFAAWLQNIYRGLRRLDVQLTPEIRKVMDRMLATDEQIAETKAQLALEPLFQTAEEADMTPEEFSTYQGQTQGRAEEVLRKKILAQLTRTAKSWWREELGAVEDEVRAELEALPLYRAVAFMRAKSPAEGFEQNKMDRQSVYELAGLATATEKKSDPNSVNPAIDSLSVAIAKLGGLDREEAEAQGIDPAHWRGVFRTKVKEGKQTQRRVPNPENFPAGIGKPLFRKPTDERGKGRTFDEMRELLAEQGMNYLDPDTTASDLLDKLLDDMSGDTQYSLNADLDLLFENPNEVAPERFRAPAQLRGLTLKGGMSPDSMAEIFGFASGAELVKQLMETPTLNFAVERQSKAVMLQRHGDILNDGTLEAEATEAAHNTEQGAALITELRKLSGQTNIAAITERKAIRDAAERIIGRKRITSLRPAQYHAAEIRSAREAQTAKDAGDLPAAQAAKQRQLFNFHLWRAATAARKSADTMRARLRTMATKKYSDKLVRPDYANQMRQFLASYNFLKSSSAGRAQAQESLEAVKTWILLQQEDESSPANVVDAEQITQIRHYSDMTLDELQAVNDIATSLMNAGRRNSKAEKAEFKANMKIMAEHIGEQTIAKKDIGIEDTKSRQRTRWGRAVFAYHRKLESFARELDGFEDLGPFWKLIIKPLLDANNKKLEMQEKANDALDDIFTGHEGLFNERKDKRSFTLESGEEIQLSLGGRISMLLNWGNEGNREALLTQRDLLLSRNDVETIIATLSDSDIDLAQDIWDYIDTFWPEIAAQERTLTGIVPSKVEAAEFEVNGRKVKGGYYPLVEDIARGRFTESDAQRESREAREKIGSTSHATTAHGWTNERKNFAGKAVDLNIDVVFNHTDAVIHDLSHRQAIKDVGRVLNNKDIADAIKTALGREAATAMKTTVDEVAGGNIKTRELSQIQSILRWSRLAVTYGALGFSLKTGFSQMLGFATAVGEFGGRDVVRRGVISYLSNPSENRKFIEEHSVFMRERGKTMHRDVTDIMLGLKGSTTMNSVKKFAFLFLLSSDRAISLPVWWGQYQVGMDRVADPAFEGFNTEQDAIDWADRSVSRTQQSGQLMDLANIESKNEFIKMWTVMYSAFSAIYQIATEQGKKAKLGKIDKIQYVYNMLWILIIPPLFEELMTGREDGDDEDSSVVNNRWTKAVAGFSLGTMAGLRETGWLMETGRNSELPIQRALKAPFDLATQVEQFEMDAAFIRAAFAIPALFHIPGGSQLTRSAQYLLALEEGDEEGFDVWEFLVTGPRENEDDE